MFGFLGRPVCVLEQNAPGYVNGTTRRFASRHAAKSSGKIARFFFDVDEASATKPDSILVDSTTNAYTSNPKIALPAANITAQGGASIGGASYGPADSYMTNQTPIVVHIYNSNAALSPTHRKIKHELPFYQTQLIQIAHDTNATPNSGNNNLSGDVDYNLAQFPELEYFSLHEVFVSNLTLRFNNKKLRHVELREMIGLSSITGKIPANVESVTLAQIIVTNIDDLLEDAVGIKALLFGIYSGALAAAVPTTTLTGAFDISHLVNLRSFVLPLNSGITSLVLPSNTNWDWFAIQGLGATASSAFDTTRIDEVLSSAAVRVFQFIATNKSIAKNIGNANFPATLLAFYCYGNQWTGDFVLTDPRTSLRDLRLGINQNEVNDFNIIDLSGLNGGALQSLYLVGVKCSNITLPASLPSLTTLEAGDNEFDIVTNSDIVTKINAYTALTALRLAVQNTTTSAAIGQNSTNGLGANPDFSALVNLQTLAVSNCKITGNMIVPNLNKILTMEIFGNTGMTGITNFAAHTSLSTLRALDCDSLNLNLSGLTQYQSIIASKWQNTIIDISGRTSTQGMNTAGGIIFSDCPNLTTLVLPAGTNNFNLLGQSFIVSNNPNLATVNNLDKIGITTQPFTFSGNALNMTFPFNANFRPNTISIQDNGMNTTNVDATIMALHANRANHVAGTKTMNIAGTNAAASGIYQAPAVAGSPASAREAIYELVNVNGWSITYN